MAKINTSILWGTVLLILGFSACTCSTEQAIQKVLGSSTETPVFLGVKALSSKEIEFTFSKPVVVSSINFDPPLEVQSISDGTSALVNLKGVMQGGERIVADLLVEDELGNTLGVLIPFRSRNERIPGLIITELRTEYANPKVEFLEFKTLSPGNLGAIRLFTAGTGMAEPVFEFPPTEVKAGEYLVLHLRTLDPASKDEIGDNLALSPGTEALPDARDFWVPEAIKRLRKTDVIILLDQDDTVLDGVLLSENPDNTWAKEDLSRAADILANQKAWLPPTGGSRSLSPRDAVPTKGATATRTICRDETVKDTNSALDWYITATSQASPGKPNSDKRYEPK
ncbi:hypothetical protein LQZ19_16635 [Treponema primitia]|uniref:hypothetical protein n=1 Tax=Treponema primitia TaxID=88058 RepID=UPI0039805E14